LTRETDSIASSRRLLAFIRSHPAAHLREIERTTGLALGVLRHHLDALLAQGLVMERRDGRLRRFFPVGLDAATRDVLGILRVRAHRAVALHLLNHPEASARDAAAALDLPHRTTLYYLRALMDGGLVAREDERYRLTDPAVVVRALVAYKPSFADRLVDAALEVWFESADQE
jgi:DNA-binding transcriptional ArsR family regulator